MHTLYHRLHLTFYVISSFLEKNFHELQVELLFSFYKIIPWIIYTSNVGMWTFHEQLNIQKTQLLLNCQSYRLPNPTIPLVQQLGTWKTFS